MSDAALAGTVPLSPPQLSELRENVRRATATLSLGDLDPAQPALFATDAMWPIFARLRDEDPVHFVVSAEFGPYWSITRWADILAVETDHKTFSSAEGIALLTLENLREREKNLSSSPPFIEMDPPRHGTQRKAVSPALAPEALARIAPLIRTGAARILDGLPIGVPFDWVDKVSIELTAMTLATLLDFPQEERRRLTYWSDVLVCSPGDGPVESWEQKWREIGACFDRFTELWNGRVNAEPGTDLISILAHGEATRHMSREEFHGNVMLLVIGGNDTTRNTISGSVYALHQYPDQHRKLREHPALIPSMVSETIRWQTPVAHMARVATRDVELGGKTIRKGDRVVIWYISANRDPREIEDPEAYLIDRERPRHHMSFGYGVHRCVGNRLAELQLTIIWEEILKRFPRIEVLSEPVRAHSIFLRGIESLPVVIPTRY
jgi:cytochrome P450